jgi:lysophospholipase L1-like esterase
MGMFRKFLAAALCALVAVTGAAPTGAALVAFVAAPAQAQTVSGAASVAAVQGVRVAMIGDSITAAHVFAQNGYSNYGLRGFWHWANLYSGQKWALDPALIKGVSGNTTTQMLARYQGDVAANYASFDILSIEGGTNDFPTGGITPSTTIPNITTMAGMALAAGKKVVIFPILPRSDYTGLSAPNQITAKNYVGQINTRLRAYALATPGVTFIDCYRDLAVPTTDVPATGVLYDGIHPSTDGARLIGRRINDTLGPLTPRPPVWSQGALDLYNATENPYGNLMVAPQLTGTGGSLGGNATGSMATGWFYFKSAGTHTSAEVTASKVAASSGYDAWSSDKQVFVVNIAGKSATEQILMLDPGAAVSLAAGTKVVAQVDVAFSGVTNIKSMTLTAADDNGTTQLGATIDGAGEVFTLPDGSYTLRTPPTTIAAGNQKVRFMLAVSFVGTVSATATMGVTNPTVHVVQ